MNNQSARRNFFVLQFHWMLTTTTFAFQHKIQLLLMSERANFETGILSDRAWRMPVCMPFLPSQHKLLDFVVLRSTGFVFLLLLTYVRPPDVVKRSRNTKPVGLFATKLKQFVLRRYERQTGILQARCRQYKE